MSVPISNCRRCGKEFAGLTCPYCTVTGVDLEALLNPEEMKLLRGENPDAPVMLVETVSGKSLAVITPLCKVGRDIANDIPLTGDRSMSRFHFQIRQTGQDYYIEDCGSRNGTFLNGSPVAMPRKIHNGDIVSAGISRYRFSIQSEEDKVLSRSADKSTNAAFLANAQKSEPSTGLLSKEIAGAREALERLRGTVEVQLELDESPFGDGNDSMIAVPSPTPASEKRVVSTFQQPAVQPAVQPVVQPAQAQALPASEPVAVSASESRLVSASGSPGVSSRSVTDELLKPVLHHKQAEQSSQPSWLNEYLLPEIQELMSEKERLNVLLEEIKQDINQIDRKIVSAQAISPALLSASGPELGQAIKMVFDMLDWVSELAPNNAFEISLKKATKIEAVVKIVVCQSDPNLRDFEALVNQQAVVWCESNFEPKGIMVVQVCPEIQPNQRKALSRDFLEDMRRKKVCVVQPTQLLAIFRLVVLSGRDMNQFRELLLTTSGAVPGFMMKPQDNRAATA